MNRPIVVCACLSLVSCCVALRAQQIRIESRVYSGSDPTPVASSLTLFDGRNGYDFSYSTADATDLSEIVIYDGSQKSVTAIDIQREMRMTLEQFQLLKMLEEQRLQLVQHEELGFLVDAKFDEQIQYESGKIDLTNPQLTYRAVGQKPQDPASMPLYYEALDSMTWLAASDPKKLPPFPRMALNQAIRKSGLMPTEVEMRLESDGKFKRHIELRSQHTVMWKLSDDDLSKIEKAKKYWMTCQAVSLSRYRNLKSAIGWKTSANRDRNETTTRNSK